jgi:hypothetical protein
MESNVSCQESDGACQACSILLYLLSCPDSVVVTPVILFIVGVCILLLVLSKLQDKILVRKN